MATQNKIKVIHILPSPKLGGVQNNLLLKSKYDKQYKIHRKIIYTVSNEGELLDRGNQLFEQSIYCPIILPDKRFRPYRFFKIYRKWMSLFFIFRLVKVLKKDDSQIVHSEDSLKLLSQVLAAWMAGKTFIWQLHTSEKIISNGLMTQLFYFFIRNNIITLIADSKTALMKNIFNKEILNKAHIIPPSVELSYYSIENYNRKIVRNKFGFSENDIIFGSTGRLHWAKGYELLINSVNQIISHQDIKLKLVIAGEGPLRTKLSELIEEYKMQSHIKLLGSVHKIGQFLQMLDFYVQPSISEAFGMAVVEAMAARIPIICSDAGGLPELIQEGKTGIIVKNNNVGALANGIVKLLNTDENELKKMTEKAYKVACCYSTEAAVKKDLIVYKSLVKQTVN